MSEARNYHKPCLLRARKNSCLQASDADDFTEEETTWLRTTSSSKVRNRFTEKNAAS